MKKILPIALIAGVALFLIHRAKQAKDFVTQANMALKAIKISIPNAFTTLLNVSLDLNNPTAQAVSLKSFYGDVLLNETVLGNINYIQPIQIPAYGKTTLNIPVSLSNLSLLSNTGTIIQSLVNGAKATIKGNANFSFGSVPFEQSISTTKA